jgi:hypothetical protein
LAAERVWRQPLPISPTRGRHVGLRYSSCGGGRQAGRSAWLKSKRISTAGRLQLSGADAAGWTIARRCVGVPPGETLMLLGNIEDQHPRSSTSTMRRGFAGMPGSAHLPEKDARGPSLSTCYEPIVVSALSRACKPNIDAVLPGSTVSGRGPKRVLSDSKWMTSGGLTSRAPGACRVPPDDADRPTRPEPPFKPCNEGEAEWLPNRKSDPWLKPLRTRDAAATCGRCSVRKPSARHPDSWVWRRSDQAITLPAYHLFEEFMYLVRAISPVSTGCRAS